MRKIIILIISILSALIIVYTSLYYNPIIVGTAKGYDFVFNPDLTDKRDDFEKYYSDEILQKGREINLFESFDFTEGDWKVCVYVHERYDISRNIPRGKYLECQDIELIKKFKDLSFVYTDGDICTLENELIMYKNNKIVFRCKVALDSNEEGFQSHQFGWIESSNHQLTQIISDFRKPLIPIVFTASQITLQVTP